jgi:hypothetical protein
VVEEHVSEPAPARFALGGLLLPGVRLAAEIAAKRQLAERLGVHDEALRLARTTGHDYAYWVDYLALALEVAESLRPDVTNATMNPRGLADGT